MRDPEGSQVPVVLVAGCPEVSSMLALDMISKIEKLSRVAVKAHACNGHLSQDVPLTSLATALLAGKGPHPDRWTWLTELVGPQSCSLLSQVLDEPRMEAVGLKPRFNRRTRRTLSQSEGIVVVIGDPKAYIGTVPSKWGTIRLGHREVRDEGIRIPV